MATKVPQKITPGGMTLAVAPPSGTTMGADVGPCGDNMFLYVRCTSAGPLTVTIDDPSSVAPSGAAGFNPDAVGTVATNAVAMFGPLRASRFANPTDGLCHWQISGTTAEIALVSV